MRYGAVHCKTVSNGSTNSNIEQYNTKPIQSQTMQYKFKYRATQPKTVSDGSRYKYRAIQSDKMQYRVGQCNAVSDLSRFKYRAMQYKTKDRAIQCDTTQSAAKARRSQMVVKTDRVLQCNTKPEQWMCEKSGFKT